MLNVNIFCSNEAGELHVFCSKLFYLVGLIFFLLMALVMLPEERREDSVTDTAVVLSISVIWRESSGSWGGFFKSLSALLLK